jgi:hypothetical protein
VDVSGNQPAGTSRPNEATVSLRILGGLAVAFLLGIAAYGLAQNVAAGASITLTTTELVNFVLAVLLSGASIFLAMTAIELGRFSEHAIVERSDQSIRLQNEVFQKTTDALQRIESSTGVTEKRIEDIISGRVGDLSQKIAKIATEHQEGEQKLGSQEVADLVKRSIYQTLIEEGAFTGRSSIEQETRRADAEARRAAQKAEFDAMTTRLLQALSARDDLAAMKMGRGNPDSQGDDMYDGIYMSKDGRRLGVIDFVNRHNPDFIRKAITAALLDLKSGNVTDLWIVIYDGDETRQKVFADTLSIVSPELRARVSLSVCQQDKIEEAARSFTFAAK